MLTDGEPRRSVERATTPQPTDGRASPFVVVVPLRRRAIPLLKAGFLVGGRIPSYKLDRAALIHFAQWGVLPHYRGLLGRPGRMRNHMVFVSVFDGDIDQYILTFSEVLPRRFAQTFGASVDFPPVRPGAGLLEYITRHYHGTLFFYSAYPGRSLLDIRSALWLEEQLSRIDPLSGSTLLERRSREIERRRQRDARRAYRTPVLTLTSLALRGNFDTVSFTTIAPVKTGRQALEELKTRLRDMDTDPASQAVFEGIPGTHYARFTVIDRLYDDQDQLMAYAPAYLLFSAQFDRFKDANGLSPPDDYAWYASMLGARLRGLEFDPWTYCEEYSPDLSSRLFVDYLKVGAVPTGLFLPGTTASAAQIRQACARDDRFRQAVDRYQQDRTEAGLRAIFETAEGAEDSGHRVG
jgi:hypothetical protein